MDVTGPEAETSGFCNVSSPLSLKPHTKMAAAPGFATGCGRGGGVISGDVTTERPLKRGLWLHSGSGVRGLLAGGYCSARS